MQCDWIYTGATISDEKKKKQTTQVPIHNGSRRWKPEYRTGPTAHPMKQTFKSTDSC